MVPGRVMNASTAQQGDVVLASITNDELCDLLKAGVARTKALMDKITEYHGGPVETEYLLTGDLLRALTEADYSVKVEYLNRYVMNGLTALPTTTPDLKAARKKLRSKRTDIVITDMFTPLAMIEIKIGVSSLRKLKIDLDKITSTIALLKEPYSIRIVGAVLFQLHVGARKDRYKAEDYLAPAKTREARIKKELEGYELLKPGFSFEWRALQGDDDGVQARALEPDGDGLAWSTAGHATRYHAILIRKQPSGIPLPPPWKRPQHLMTD